MSVCPSACFEQDMPFIICMGAPHLWLSGEYTFVRISISSEVYMKFIPKFIVLLKNISSY